MVIQNKSEMPRGRVRWGLGKELSPGRVGRRCGCPWISGVPKARMARAGNTLGQWKGEQDEL